MPARIVCGNGSDELLTLIANAYLRPGDEVLFSAHAFLVYRIATLANSATPVAAPEPELRVDVDAMLARVTPNTRLVFVANPNNPTGTWIPRAELRRLHAGSARRMCCWYSTPPTPNMCATATTIPAPSLFRSSAMW